METGPHLREEGRGRPRRWVSVPEDEASHWGNWCRRRRRHRRHGLRVSLKQTRPSRDLNVNMFN
jgi:hypothetical protein